MHLTVLPVCDEKRSSYTLGQLYGQIRSVQDTQPLPDIADKLIKPTDNRRSISIYETQLTAGLPWRLSGPPNHSQTVCLTCAPHAKCKEGTGGSRKINKSSILMAHFRGTLPLSLGPDISKETTSQPPFPIKSSHPCTLRASLSRKKSQKYV